MLYREVRESPYNRSSVLCALLRGTFEFRRANRYSEIIYVLRVFAFQGQSGKGDRYTYLLDISSFRAKFSSYIKRHVCSVMPREFVPVCSKGKFRFHAGFHF